MNITGELVRGLSYEEYAERPGVTASLLKVVLTDSLRSVKAYIDGARKESEDLTFGKAFHSLLLENKREYVVQPEAYFSTTDKKNKPWNWNSKSCKQWRDEQTLPVLTKDSVADLEGMVKSVQAETSLQPFLNGGEPELSVFCKERAIKGRFDLLHPDPQSPIIDIKKTRSANPKNFVKQIFSLKYYVQAAFYMDLAKYAGTPRDEFWFVAVEDFAPYNVSVVKLIQRPIGFLDLGRQEYRGAYDKLMKAIDTKHWPSWGACDSEEHLTPWMMAEMDKVA